jgi:hypothetical protein
VFNQEFGWYHLIYMAANGEFTKINEVIKSNFQDFLTFCNYQIRKSKVEANALQQITNKK